VAQPIVHADRRPDGGGTTEVVRFLGVGVASYAVDISLLYLLHQPAGLALWLATTVAYAAGLAANFALNRAVTFRSTSRLRTQVGRYAVLLAANYAATIAMVTGLTAAGSPYLLSKTVCVAVLALANFFLYRHWVFTTAVVG
jgi:putative flippase GtrA